MRFPLLGLLLSLHLLLLTLFNKVFLSSRGVGRRLRPSGKGCRQEPKGQQQTHEVRGLQALGEGQWREQGARGGRTKESNRTSVYQEEKIVSDLLCCKSSCQGAEGRAHIPRTRRHFGPCFCLPALLSFTSGSSHQRPWLGIASNESLQRLVESSASTQQVLLHPTQSSLPHV